MSSRPNTDDHAKKLAISLTNKLAYHETLMKKEDATRAKDNKKKYYGSSRVKPWTKLDTKKIHAASTILQKLYLGKNSLCNEGKRHHIGEFFTYNKFNRKDTLPIFSKTRKPHQTRKETCE